MSEVLALFINALCPALLPLLVQYAHAPERITFLTQTGTRLILTILIAMSLLIFGYAPWIAKMYGPGYMESADCIQILICSQAFAAVNALCYYLLLVYNAQGKRAVILGNLALTAFNVILNLVLIPPFKAQGASWATVITEVGLFVMTVLFVQRYTPIRLWRNMLPLLGLAMLSGLIAINLGIWGGITSAIAFVALVFALRLLTPVQLKQLAMERMAAAPVNDKADPRPEVPA